MKIWLERICIAAVFFAIGFATAKFKGCDEKQTPPASNNTVMERQQIQSEKDAKLGVLDVPFKTEVKPKTVYQQKGTKEYVNKISKEDLVTSAKADKSNLQIFTFNPSDSSVKEYNYDNPGRKWSITKDKNGNLKLVKNYWYWRTLMAGIEYKTSPSDIQQFDRSNLSILAKTRVEFQDMIELEIKAKHNLGLKPAINNIELNAELNFTIIK